MANEAAALARLARSLHIASYGAMEAGQEVFSHAGPADTRSRNTSRISAEAAQERRERGAVESNEASGRVLARGRARQVLRSD